MTNDTQEEQERLMQERRTRARAGVWLAYCRRRQIPLVSQSLALIDLSAQAASRFPSMAPAPVRDVTPPMAELFAPGEIPFNLVSEVQPDTRPAYLASLLPKQGEQLTFNFI